MDGWMERQNGEIKKEERTRIKGQQDRGGREDGRTAGHDKSG
jgi:hypothetical protein